jgi:hypothetical protein
VERHRALRRQRQPRGRHPVPGQREAFQLETFQRETLKSPRRLWLVAGVALAALVAIGAVLNAISRLIWDLQTVLP